jgi:hypothetical protein
LEYKFVRWCETNINKSSPSNKKVVLKKAWICFTTALLPVHQINGMASEKNLPDDASNQLLWRQQNQLFYLKKKLGGRGGSKEMSDEFQVLDSPANNTRFTLTRFDKLSIFLSIDRDWVYIGKYVAKQLIVKAEAVANENEKWIWHFIVAGQRTKFCDKWIEIKS